MPIVGPSLLLSFVYLRSPPTFAAEVIFTKAYKGVIAVADDVVVVGAIGLEVPPPPVGEEAITPQVRVSFGALPILARWLQLPSLAWTVGAGDA